MTGRLTQAVISGIANSAPALTYDVQEHTKQYGWPDSATQSLRVTSIGRAALKLTGSKEAEDWEYGGLSNEPSGAVRNWAHGGAAERALITLVGHHLDGIL